MDLMLYHESTTAVDHTFGGRWLVNMVGPLVVANNNSFHKHIGSLCIYCCVIGCIRVYLTSKTMCDDAGAI